MTLTALDSYHLKSSKRNTFHLHRERSIIHNDDRGYLKRDGLWLEIQLRCYLSKTMRIMPS